VTLHCLRRFFFAAQREELGASCRIRAGILARWRGPVLTLPLLWCAGWRPSYRLRLCSHAIPAHHPSHLQLYHRRLHASSAPYLANGGSSPAPRATFRGDFSLRAAAARLFATAYHTAQQRGRRGRRRVARPSARNNSAFLLVTGCMRGGGGTGRRRTTTQARKPAGARRRQLFAEDCCWAAASCARLRISPGCFAHPHLRLAALLSTTPAPPAAAFRRGVAKTR